MTGIWARSPAIRNETSNLGVFLLSGPQLPGAVDPKLSKKPVSVMRLRAARVASTQACGSCGVPVTHPATSACPCCDEPADGESRTSKMSNPSARVLTCIQFLPHL